MFLFFTYKNSALAMEEVKNKKCKYNTFCYVCLSKDRQLSSIGKYASIFNMFCEKTIELKSTEKTLLKRLPLLCWECMAILKRIKEFKEKVKCSSRILAKIAEKQLPFQTLSNLRISTEESVNVKRFKFYEDIKSDNKHLMVELKKEIFDDIECAVSYENNDIYYEEVKEESVIRNYPEEEGTKHLCEEDEKCYNSYSKEKIYKKYTILYGKHDIVDTENLTRKVSVDSSELQARLNEIKKEDLFASLKYKCETCVLGWFSQHEFDKHYTKYHDMAAGNYTCETCTCRFRTKKKLCLHKLRHSYLLECRLCSYKAYPALMRRHLATHSRLYECNQCKAKFGNFYIFNEHHKKLHSEYICDICGKHAKSRNMIIKHLSYHYECHDCSICGRSYKNRKSYLHHVSMKHSPATESCYCVACDKRFDNAKLYQRHVRSSAAHAAERDGSSAVKKVPCPDCGRLYSRKTYMMNHYRYVHQKRSKYYCEQCDKPFLNRTRYVEHTKFNHDGVKKLKNKLCNVCGRGFAETRTLINHIRTHSGERPFECEHCGAKFTQKVAMLSHINHIHLKKKRRPCWL